MNCAFASFLLATASFVSQVSGQEAAVNISFLHINDHHSNINEHALDLGPGVIPVNNLSIETQEIRMFYGGAARQVAAIKLLRDEARDAGNETYILHAGDALTGTLFYTVYGPVVDYTWMNAANIFDALVIGNHEFDDGDIVMAEFARNLNTTVLSANLNPSNTSAIRDLIGTDNEIVPFHIKTLSNSDRVGTCGITVKLVTEQSSSPDPGTTFDDEFQAAQKCVEQLVEMGINKIVVLSHVGVNIDTTRLAIIPNVDVVIGGHDHAFFGNDEIFTQFGISVLDTYAVIVNGTCVATAWEFNKVFGKLDVSFDDQGNVLGCTGTPYLPFDPNVFEVRDAPQVVENSTVDVFLGSEDSALMTEALVALGPFLPIGEDQDVADSLIDFNEQLQVEIGRSIATAAENICHARFEAGINELCPDRPEQSLVGGGVCNIVAQSFLAQLPAANFSIQNAGGCRTDILSGDFTVGNAFEILPFSNTLVTFVMTGAQIKAVLEDAAAFFFDTGGGSGSIPFAAGLRWDVDTTAVFGSRYHNIEMNNRLKQKSWEPLDMNATYTVVTNSFVADGRDGYDTFGMLDQNDPNTFQNTFVEYGQSLVDYAKDVQVLTDIPLSQYSTQVQIREGGQVISLRDLQEDADEEGAQGVDTEADGEVQVETSSAFVRSLIRIAFVSIVAAVSFV